MANIKYIQEEEKEVVVPTKSLELTDKVEVTNGKVLIKATRMTYEIPVSELLTYVNADFSRIVTQVNFYIDTFANTTVYKYNNDYKFIGKENIVFDFVKNKVIIPDNSTTTTPPVNKPGYDIVYNTSLSSWTYKKLEEIKQVESDEDLKSKRNNLLTSTDWLVIRHRDEIFLGKITTLDNKQFTELQDYRNRLRVMFDNLDLNKEIIFPSKPEFI